MTAEDPDNQGGLRLPALAELREDDGTVVVRFQGELDLHNAPELRAAFDDALARAPARLVVDLSDVEFLDSTALSALLQARKRQVDRGAFRVAAPGAEARRVLRLAGVERHLDVFDSLDDALLA